jgi:hypothetical protein
MKLSLLISTYDQPVSLAKVLCGTAQPERRHDQVFIAMGSNSGAFDAKAGT